MIISASRRTDIPAFYSEWFLNRLKEGYLKVRNPYNPAQEKKIILDPEAVDCIVFWTKDPRRLMEKLPEIDDRGYSYYFQFTLTGYGPSLEKRVPEAEKSIETFKELSCMIGPERVVWRYDPILLTDRFRMDYHFKRFKNLACELSGHTRKCVISFMDMYKKCERNLKGMNLIPIDYKAAETMAPRFREIADGCGLSLESCAEEFPMEDWGIKPGKCIDGRLVSEITGKKISLPKDKSQRRFCGCAASVDAGAYDTCLHGCRYCYANSSPESARRNFKRHDPNSLLLHSSE